ncbi:anticodon nuclease [Burkholderia cenocepacia]|uniref:AAA family ATPase n=1 Tax=Burkholderia cenocepacia TaxID=95486 RepID=UPI000F5BC96E|nr:AAA family ATPase [Burkholderia cenocepacia]RQV06193.1 anticodon nuclease [Burkholderia cenocepacia]
MTAAQHFADLPALAAHLRRILEDKNTVLLYAYNGTGKTRLSMAFKDIGKQGQGDEASRDTLYFNAFTEDLFHWDNDLDADSDRRLLLNTNSRFFKGLFELEMDNRIRPLLQRFAGFDFRIDVEAGAVRFWPKGAGDDDANIKVSRGEENIFIWCFFLAVVQLAMDPEIEAYRWVKYLYIDDPISSLDEHNAIAVANHLAQLLKRPESSIKTVISSHHPLFFNVMHNELDARKSKKVAAYFLSRAKSDGNFALRYTNATPFFHHVAVLTELYQAEQSGELYTYHFNMLRSVLEKSASFHGFSNFSACLTQDSDDDQDGTLHARLINILSHGNYSLYEPQQMLEENKQHFRKILHDFLNRYPFNPDLFPAAAQAAEAAGTS